MEAPKTPQLNAATQSMEDAAQDAPLEAPKGLKMDPKPHQERVADKLKSQPGLLAYHGLGTGKTFTAINAAHQHNMPLLAIAPASLRNNMRKEIESSGFSQPFKVLSYDEARNRLNDPGFREFASKALVAYDEAHRMGKSESQRSQLAHEVPGAKKLFLSGTPMRNAPHEVSPLINAIAPGSLPEKERGFKDTFLTPREVPVGFWGRVRGEKPGKEFTPTNLQQFQEAVKGRVDFHEAVDRSAFPSHSESVVEVPMTKRQQATYNFVLGKYPEIAYKVKHGLPLNKREQRDFRAFLSGPRQVVNHPGGYNTSATDDDAPKIRKAADEIHERFKKDPNFRGVHYSAFLDTGVRPMQRELERRGIPHAVFTGEQGDQERKAIIEKYNRGEVPMLLISGAGAEGLDLKGTKLMQILEPHWQEEQIDQVRGRAIRYRSHDHLPDHERHVEVQRFHAVPRAGMLDKVMRRPRAGYQSADEYLYDRAKRKQEINRPFLEALKQSEFLKTASALDGDPLVAFLQSRGYTVLP